MRITGLKRAIKPGGNRQPIARPKAEKAEPRFRDHPLLDTVLTLQKRIGNRAVGSFTSDQRIQRQKAAADYFTDPVQAFQRYGTAKTRLERELRAINRIGNKAQKQKKQEEFLKGILDKVIGSDPFAEVKIGALAADTNAETGWVDDEDHAKGVQVVFNELVLTDPLESIIQTCAHESLHARHLKGGVPYRAFSREPTNRDYLNAVAALSEMDSYTMNVQSPFFQKLAPARQKSLKDQVKKCESEAIAAFQKMNTFRHAGLQRQLKALFPKFIYIQAWLRSNPPRWEG